MRPLEILILALAAVWFVLPGLTRRRGIRQGVGLLLAMTVPWQLAIEGYRWQMVPAYAVAAVIGLATWWEFIGPSEDFSMPQRGAACRPRPRRARSASPLSPCRSCSRCRGFPQPAGTFEVGTFSLHLVDESRMEVLGARPGRTARAHGAGVLSRRTRRRCRNRALDRGSSGGRRRPRRPGRRPRVQLRSPRPHRHPQLPGRTGIRRRRRLPGGRLLPWLAQLPHRQHQPGRNPCR